MRIYLVASILAAFSCFSSALADEGEPHCGLRAAVGYMRDQYNDPGLYMCGGCLDNSGELGRRITQAFGPRVNQDEVNVVVIYHRDFPLFRDRPELDEDITLRGMQARSHRVHNWRFHAVLEWNGQVLDMDLAGGGEAVAVREYVDRMFPLQREPRQGNAYYSSITLNRPRELMVRRVPLRRYLELHPRRPFRTGNLEDYSFVLDYRPVSLRDYVRGASRSRR